MSRRCERNPGGKQFRVGKLMGLVLVGLNLRCQGHKPCGGSQDSDAGRRRRHELSGRKLGRGCAVVQAKSVGPLRGRRSRASTEG